MCAGNHSHAKVYFGLGVLRSRHGCILQAGSIADWQMSSAKEQVIWGKILDTYQKAQESGAAVKFKTNSQILTDQRLSIKFVLRVSESLRDKPKPPKSRYSKVLLDTIHPVMSTQMTEAHGAVRSRKRGETHLRHTMRHSGWTTCLPRILSC